MAAADGGADMGAPTRSFPMVRIRPASLARSLEDRGGFKTIDAVEAFDLLARASNSAIKLR